MRKIIFLSVFTCILAIAGSTSAGKSVSANNLKATGKICLPVNQVEAQLPSFSTLSPANMVLDSIYGYNWLSNDWTLVFKNYYSKDATGRTIQNHYKKLNFSSGQYEDYARFLYGYTGSETSPSSSTGQLFDISAWNTFQYIHSRTGDLVDTAWHKDWDPVHHKFIHGFRNTFDFNDSLLPLENVNQLWDTTTLAWMNSSRNIYSYSSTMKPTEQIMMTWDQDSLAWKNLYRYLDSYDENDLLISHYEYSWVDSTSSWLPAVRISYYNNGVALPELTVEEFWNVFTSTWDSVSITNSIFNQYYWLMTENKQIYYNTSGKWMEDHLTTYRYSAYGTLKGYDGSIWDTVHNTWVHNEYNAIDSISGKVAEYYFVSINSVSFLPSSGSRNLYVYKPTGDTLSINTQHWGVANNAWVNSTQETFTWSTNNLLTEKLDEIWSDSLSSWVNSKKSEYYYSDFIGFNEHVIASKPCVFANPVKAGALINCPDFTNGENYILRVWSLSGSELYRIQLVGGKAVIIPSSILPGIYFLTIEQQNKIVWKDKMVVVN